MAGPDCLSDSTLSGFFAGDLPVEQVMQVERHLNGCPACAARVSDALERSEQRPAARPGLRMPQARLAAADASRPDHRRRYVWPAAGLAALLLGGGVAFLLAPGAGPRPVLPETTSAPPPAPEDFAPPGTVSARPKSPVPIPTLPRELEVTDRAALARACQEVEEATVAAGVSAPFARGITLPFQRAIADGDRVLPVAMYYFIVREAALKHDHDTAAANLAASHARGLLSKLRNLPAVSRSP